MEKWKDMETDLLVYGCALSKVFAYKCAAGRQLLEHFGGLAALFAAGRKELAAVMPGGAKMIDQLLDPALLDWAAQEVEWAQTEGIRLLVIDQPGYPRRLAACEDAPLLLYCKGTVDLDAPRALAVVGTRKASWHGREACRRVVGALGDLAEKPLIVSGLALGIDGCAHLTALENGLATVAVLPCGLDEIYPRQHEELARRIAAHGALVSDFARGTAPVAFTFLRRNRIIAGLADATLLAESYRRGGGLITMQLASSYNRDTFAIPGRLSDASFEGNNRLIAKQEEVLVADEETIPVTLGWAEALCRQHRSPLLRPGDTPQQRTALQLLQQRGPLSVDAVAALMSIGVDAASVLLLELEMAGRVGGDGNNFFVSL